MNEKEAIDIIRLQRSKGIADSEILNDISTELGQRSSVALLSSMATPQAIATYKRHTAALQWSLALFLLMEVAYLIYLFQYLLLFIPFTFVFAIGVLGLIFCTVNLRQHVANFYTGAIACVITMVSIHVSNLFGEWNKLLLFDVSQIALGVIVLALAGFVRIKKFPSYREA